MALFGTGVLLEYIMIRAFGLPTEGPIVVLYREHFYRNTFRRLSSDDIDVEKLLRVPSQIYTTYYILGPTTWYASSITT